FQIYHDPFGHAFADAVGPLDEFDVTARDRSADLVGVADTEDANRHLRADTVDAKQQFEKLFGFKPGKAEQIVRRFADVFIYIEFGWFVLSQRAVIFICHVDAVADATDVKHDDVQYFFSHRAIESRNHP